MTFRSLKLIDICSHEKGQFLSDSLGKHIQTFSSRNGAYVDFKLSPIYSSAHLIHITATKEGVGPPQIK